MFQQSKLCGHNHFGGFDFYFQTRAQKGMDSLMLSGYFLPIPKEKQKVVWQTTKVNTNTSIGHE